MKFESRFLKAPGLEVRESQTGSPVIAGTGIVYNKLSQDLGGWFERIDPAAANKTLGDGARNVYASFNHDANYILGRVGAGTLRMANTADGLQYEIDPPLTSPMGQHVLEACRRGDVAGSSFTFRCVTAPTWEVTEDGRSVRTVTELALFELGPVVSPAYLDTDASARQVIAELSESRSLDPREVEACLREGNLRDIVRAQLSEAPVSVRTATVIDLSTVVSRVDSIESRLSALEGTRAANPADDVDLPDPADDVDLPDPAEDGAADPSTTCGNCGTEHDGTGRCGSCGAFTKSAQDGEDDGTTSGRSTTPQPHVTPRLTIARHRLEALTRGA